MIEIVSRYTGSVLYRSETAESMRAAIISAVAEDSNLEDSNLEGADLRGSNLRGANLEGANLRDSNLRGADLRDSNLEGANLEGANLRDSNLEGANLRDSNLEGANLRDSNLTPIRDDLWAVLSAAPTEVRGLRQALLEGRVDGSTYTGECACLVGTVAKLKGVYYREIPAVSPDANRPIERFFLAIRKGDTPETSQFSRLAVEWIDQWPPLKFIPEEGAK